MNHTDFNHLAVFITVAREKSFTRAAAHLGVSQSAISHSIRGLEERLGIRLLTRTTRGAVPTEAGERLLANLVPYYDGIETELATLGELREKPGGTIRISSHDHAATTILWPKLSKLLREYPDITLEINVDYGLIDIVAGRFDAGVRIGDQIAKDMIAMRISPDFRMVVVGSPDYFARYPKPQTPHDLTSHNCANLRLSTHGGLFAWEFTKEGQELRVQVPGQMIFNTSPQLLTAALEGYGLAYAPEDVVQKDIREGRLVAVLEDWSPILPGYHLYYPSRRQALPAFKLILNALKLNRV
ncbi:LysR family transcriptional regulator [Rahnella sp. Lac-M11]|jgi:DNA-binding transcriptional LysR family regulator|uniref:LysR family transcriptional regulator n=2 Tax=Bacteria TaxID=2 RepID=A0A6M2B836_9GAMM|nr:MULTISPECIES: LysR family transcriptional regulator [Yersiniaceae]MCS3424537.1 DNA-binding transcriptional LysR family regulator [Rahnella sp. BIGb0603]NGX88791.1 LysR family transcriptional regulator [Rahnella contaminans]CFQ45921.1 LysR family transcriptional regulator [Yersinia aleksiciae]